jgi:hypothetical protein
MRWPWNRRHDDEINKVHLERGDAVEALRQSMSDWETADEIATELENIHTRNHLAVRFEQAFRLGRVAKRREGR